MNRSWHELWGVRLLFHGLRPHPSFYAWLEDAREGVLYDETADSAFLLFVWQIFRILLHLAVAHLDQDTKQGIASEFNRIFNTAGKPPLEFIQAEMRAVAEELTFDAPEFPAPAHPTKAALQEFATAIRPEIEFPTTRAILETLWVDRDLRDKDTLQTVHRIEELTLDEAKMLLAVKPHFDAAKRTLSAIEPTYPDPPKTKAQGGALRDWGDHYQTCHDLGIKVTYKQLAYESKFSERALRVDHSLHYPKAAKATKPKPKRPNKTHNKQPNKV